jgi:hypothetical protein
VKPRSAAGGGSAPLARAPSGKYRAEREKPTRHMPFRNLSCGGEAAISGGRGQRPLGQSAEREISSRAGNIAPSGKNGPKRGRTADLYTASVALYQLSYRPTSKEGLSLPGVPGPSLRWREKQGSQGSQCSLRSNLSESQKTLGLHTVRGD